MPQIHKYTNKMCLKDPTYTIFISRDFKDIICLHFSQIRKNIPLAVNIDLGLKYTRVLLKGVIESTYGEEKE